MKPPVNPVIGIIAHAGKEGAGDLVRAVTGELARRGASYLVEKSAAIAAGLSSDLDEAGVAERSGALLVMGGDGSILRALHRSGGHVRPVFGLNIGSLGFLTCLGSGDYLRAIDCLISGDYELSERSLMEASISGPAGMVPLELALNDVTVSRGERSQLVRLRTWVAGTPLTEYHADGLIVATPTGSTAYSLAAGGPILMPGSGSLVITPVCPHVLSNRSLVISDRDEVAIEPTGGQDVFVSVDGRPPQVLPPGGRLVLRLSSVTLPLAVMPDTSFPDILRQKLRWSGSTV